PHEIVREIGRPGEVVRDAAENHLPPAQTEITAARPTFLPWIPAAWRDRNGHSAHSSDAHCTTNGASSRIRFSVIRTLGPAMLTVPTAAPPALERMAAAIA